MEALELACEGSVRVAGAPCSKGEGWSKRARAWIEWLGCRRLWFNLVVVLPVIAQNGIV